MDCRKTTWYPIGYDGWKNKDGTFKTEAQAKKRAAKHWRVKCDCGWRGDIGELLGCDETETMKCPQCTSSGWIYL